MFRFLKQDQTFGIGHHLWKLNIHFEFITDLLPPTEKCANNKIRNMGSYNDFGFTLSSLNYIFAVISRTFEIRIMLNQVCKRTFFDPQEYNLLTLKRILISPELTIYSKKKTTFAFELDR